MTSINIDNQPVSSNLLEIDKKNSVSKEIAKDIILHKIHKQVANSADGAELKYMFIVESRAIKEIEFIADFTGSENIVVEQSVISQNTSQIQTKQEKNSLIVKKDIGPLQQELVAKVRLLKNWKLKSKFRFTLKNPTIEKQKDLLRKYLAEFKMRLEQARKLYNMIPFSLMNIEQIENKIKEVKMTSFIDLEFEPIESSVYDNGIDSPFDVIVHWRRPIEFMQADFQEGLLEPNIFYDTIEPNDIKLGLLGNEWFLSALAMLAERPALIERLFITKEVNQFGVYRVKLCKNGEWVTVTVDDYFPCFPEGEPLFAKCHGNELWVIILEKAYAKLHGNYFLLRGGFVNEALLDLTGCPSISYDLEDEYVQHFIENGQFWELIKYFDEEGYLISFSTYGESRWTDNNRAKEEEQNDQNSFPKGQAFTIILVKEVLGNQIINLRSPLQPFEWKGDWNDKSQKWTPQIKEALGPLILSQQEEQDGTFWMSYQDAIKSFRSLNVCRVKNWEEVRIKGKFIRVQDIDDPNIEVVLSKWYYSIDLHETTRIFVSLHQEDERIKGVLARRPYLDIGIAIIKRTNDGVELVDLKDFIQDRQCEIEVTLEPGSYIILPRTTGCLLRRPEGAYQDNIQLMNSHGQLNELFETTINDIFRKFDMLLNRELSYCEFKGFCECIGRNLTEKEFQSEILQKYTSTQRGLTLKGFKEFFKSQLQEIKNSNGNEEQVWQWLENLGYDRDLYSIRSRCFILTFHSQVELSVTVRDAVQTDLDARTSLLIIEKFGQELENKKGYKILYTFSEQIHAYSYAVQNMLQKTVDIILDCSSSQNMVFSSKTNKIQKRVEAGHTEFMMHSMALPNVNKFVRSAKCTIKEINQSQQQKLQ